jgi:hypothetical protein
LSEANRVAFRAALGKALADTDRRHLLNPSDFESYLDDHATDVPTCFKGLEPCISPKALAFDQLGLTALIEVEVTRSGEQLEARYRLVDRRGETTKESTARGKTTRRLAFSLVRDLFDATGSVAIRSTPSGAAVQIDGETVGTTPLETRLPIGTHSFGLQLPGHRTADGSFELTSGASLTVEKELGKRPGELLVENAPEGAVLTIDGESRGKPGEPLELPPGNYTLKVTADGYQAYSEAIAIDSGERVERSIPLERNNPLLRDVSVNEIALNHYVARLTYDHSLHPTSFRDARARVDGREFEFAGFADDAGNLPDDRVVRRLLDPNGIRFDLSYTGRNFGVVGLSLSYAATGADRRVFIDQSRSGNDTVTGRLTSLRRLQLRPLQISYRHFFGNFVPSLEIGTGLSFQWMRIEGLPNRDPITLRQTEAYWTIAASAQYFFDENWFGIFRYGVQDYFNRGKGVEHVLSLGAGVALPNLFGFEPEPPEEL